MAFGFFFPLTLNTSILLAYNLVKLVWTPPTPYAQLLWIGKETIWSFGMISPILELASIRFMEAMAVYVQSAPVAPAAPATPVAQGGNEGETVATEGVQA